jgi:VCBS repeat-containing protein
MTGSTATNWLGADHSSGMVAPGQTATLQVQIHSHDLLPGTYLSTLVFAGGKGNSQVYNSPQSVSISLTVQEHCDLVPNTGNLAFTAIVGQDNPGNQTLNLAADTSCPDSIGWKTTSSANWITMTPANGQLKGKDTASMNVGINTSNLRKPGVYNATLVITTGQSSHTVMVQLTLQKQPTPTAPIMSAAPLNLNFAANQGQGNLPGQTVTITNSGHSALHWDSTTNAQLDPWLTTEPTSGTIAPGQTEQMTVTVNAGSLAPGNYTAQIQLNGTDAAHALAGGSPQSVVVNFQISAPCVLAKPSSSTLAFSATQGSTDPAPQNISITASGNCSWPLNWSIQNIPSWLKLSPASGTLTANNPTATISVAPSIADLTANQNVQLPISVTDSAKGQVQGSPVSFGVSLTLQAPCSVKITPNSLAFTPTQAQATIAVQASDTCSSISWHATANDGNAGWLSVNASGSGNGDILVKADSVNLRAGDTYTGSITVTASDSSGNPVQGGSQTIAVSLKIPAAATFTISGTVNACADTDCSVLQSLGNAQVMLIDSSGQQIKTTGADGSGNFTFSNISSGSYTIESSGIDSANISYNGSKTISVSGDLQVTLQDTASTPTTGATPLVAQ